MGIHEYKYLYILIFIGIKDNKIVLYKLYLMDFIIN